MNTDPIRLERRSTQRFCLNLPISVRRKGTIRESYGVTQDLSARGVLFYTDLFVAEGEEIEITLQMPSEITLTEAMRVCCQGTVTRVLPLTAGQARGVAVRLQGYEYLPDSQPITESSATFGRIVALHPRADEKESGTARRGASPRGL